MRMVKDQWRIKELLPIRMTRSSNSIPTFYKQLYKNENKSLGTYYLPLGLFYGLRLPFFNYEIVVSIGHNMGLYGETYITGSLSSLMIDLVSLLV